MGNCYSKGEIRDMWSDICDGPPEFLYKRGVTLFNYTGNMKCENNIQYIEFLSEILIENFKILEKIKTESSNLRENKPFIRHLGISKSYSKSGEKSIVRCDENPFAMALFNSGYRFPHFGKIIDYNLSLKENKTSGPGSIDLISQKTKDEIFVIELKTSETNRETLLRAIMEVFTFVILLNKIKSKFYREMKEVIELDQNFSFRP
ncbi:MAG: hypothetical protein QCH96_06890, partial [Candidatus Thermoplasmatota archaeon]|nr:hypothetical protein [Candidatus Thermoplasmatota archaeon]